MPGPAGIAEPRSRWARAAVLVAGIVATQVLLYGPSLSGQKILLPLDILKLPRFYLPITPETKGYVALDGTLSDEIISIELRRRYAAREVRQGRLPLWNPYNYCGAPFIAANNTAVFSPFRLVDYLFPSPVTIAWVQLLKSLVGGIGAYWFFRRAIGVSFWPAVVAAWSFPLIGFLILWRGYPPSFVAVWLPWLLLATDATVRRPGGLGTIGLAVATALLLVSGHAGVAAHALLASGAYALVACIDAYGRQSIAWQRLGVVVALLLGWGLGFLLSAPQNLPTIEYLAHSRRVARREAGRVEFPSVGPAALPLLVCPYFYGSWQRGSLYIAPGGHYEQGIYHAPNARSEEAAMGYAGLIMTLLAAPWAFWSRRHRVMSIGWLAIGLFALSHTLGIPGLALLFRVFPLRLLQNNRFVFVTAFAVLALGAIGLEVLLRRWRFPNDAVRGQATAQASPRAASGAVFCEPVPRWFWVPCVTTIVGLGAWCLVRIVVWPEPIVRLSLAPGIPAAAAATIRMWFARNYAFSALFCALAVAGWAVVLLPHWRRAWMPAVGAALLVGEMVFNAWGVNPQVSPALYYPRLPALEALHDAPPGRICGWNCLPACLNQTHDLYDIRGYDGAGPRHLMELFERCELWVDGRRVDNHNTHGSQWFIPPLNSPILDMLNLRYRIYRGTPPPEVKPRFIAPDYWVRESKTCLPRVYVPARYERETDPQKTLGRLSQPDFDARQLALVAGNVEPPQQRVRGRATLVEEEPQRLVIDVEMETPGLVVLADLWYPGWQATYNGQPIDIFRTNHALRGMLVPAGAGRLELRYKPPTFYVGLWLFAAALLGLVMWGTGVTYQRRRASGRAGDSGEKNGVPI